MTSLLFFRWMFRHTRSRIIQEVRARGGEALISGAPAMVIRCVEPALSPSTAVARFEDFMTPYMRGAGIDTREGVLFDTVALPGMIRHISVAGDGNIISTAIWEVTKWVLLLLLDAHGTEVIFLFEHLDCAERKAANKGMAFSFSEEVFRACNSMEIAEKRILTFCAQHDRRPQVVRCIGIVTQEHDSRRRLTKIYLAEELLQLAVDDREQLAAK